MLERQHRLDQPSHSSGSVEVTYVRFHGSHSTIAVSIRCGAKCFCECGDFNGVAKRSSGAVSFDISNAAGVNMTSRPMRHGNDLGLPVDARSSEAYFLLSRRC